MIYRCADLEAVAKSIGPDVFKSCCESCHEDERAGLEVCEFEMGEDMLRVCCEGARTVERIGETVVWAGLRAPKKVTPDASKPDPASGYNVVRPNRKERRKSAKT